MRENRLYGSEGGAGVQPPRSYPYPGPGSGDLQVAESPSVSTGSRYWNGGGSRGFACVVN
jgi:hypothetical protein